MKRALICALLGLLGAAEWLLFASASIKSEVPGGDFPILYAGAKLATENPVALYDAQSQFQIEQEVTRSEGWSARFLYPPFFVLVISPLGRMDYAASYWVWTEFTGLLYLASVLLLIREFRGNALTLVCAALASPAFHWLVLSGQTTAIALLIFVLIYIAMSRQRCFATGALIALLAYRPQFMILIAPICLIKLGRSAVFGFLAMLSTLVVAGAVGFSLESYARYFALLQEMADLLRLGFHPLGFFISAYGLLRALGSETLAIAGCFGSAVVAGYWLFVHWPTEGDVDRLAAWFASLVVATLLTMSYALVYDLLLIILVIALTSGPWLRGTHASALAFLYCAPIFYFFLGYGSINFSAIALGWLFVTMNRLQSRKYFGSQAPRSSGCS